MLRHRGLILLAMTACLLESSESSADALAPIQAFARTPSIAQASISPDGRFLAFVMSTGDTRSVVVRDRSGKELPRTVWSNADPEELDVTWCRWANPTRLLCGLAGVPRNSIPRAIPATRLIGVDFDGGRFVMLKQSAMNRVFTQYQDQIVDWTPAEVDSVLIQMRDDYDRTGLYRLNIYTSESELLTRLPTIAAFRSDGAGNVRLAHASKESASTACYARLHGHSAWRSCGTFDYLEANEAVDPLAVIAGTDRFIGLRHHQGRLALWEASLQGREPPRLLFSDPKFDVGEPVFGPSGNLLGIDYHTDRPATFYLDRRARSVIEGANRFLTDSFNSIHDMTPDGSAYIVRSTSDIDAGTYHLLDVSSGSGELLELGTAYPELRAHPLGRMQPIVYPARDGVRIPAYLTRPPQQSGKPVPLVVLLHDYRPSQTTLTFDFLRATWTFDFLRAFLTSRGYAVLEMNHRGSTGYGLQWRRAAIRDLGGQAYDDITDAVRWAIAKGIVDAERICIAGRGYGGTLALLGAARHSDMYRCAIAIGAWADLVDAKHYAKRWIGVPPLFAKVIGNHSGRLWDQSPMHYAEDIRIPVLLAHAERDWRVLVTQATAMSRRLKSLCKPHELLVLERTDQSLRWQSDRMALLSGIEKFLQAHLQGERAPDPPTKRVCRAVRPKPDEKGSVSTP